MRLLRAAGGPQGRERVPGAPAYAEACSGAAESVRRRSALAHPALEIRLGQVTAWLRREADGAQAIHVRRHLLHEHRPPARARVAANVRSPLACQGRDTACQTVRPACSTAAARARACLHSPKWSRGKTPFSGGRGASTRAAGVAIEESVGGGGHQTTAPAAPDPGRGGGSGARSAPPSALWKLLL